MTSRHYTQGQADHTLFYKHSDNGKCCILIVYVDDIILTGDDSIEIERLKEFLSLEFQLKDLGNLRYFLGMEVARSKAGISISERKYVLDLLSEVGLLGCKPAETPMEPNLKLGTDKDGEEVDRGRYQREKHLEAAYRILRYLKGTPGKGLNFKKDVNRSIEVYTDADWAGAVNDRRSTSGYCSYVWGNLVTWRSKKQSVVACSSAESEYRALSHGICEGMWLQRLMGELKLSYTKPITLYCDNQAAVSIAHNPVHHDRTKHVEIGRHFITEKINKGEICVSYLLTRQQVADVLTKRLSRKMFEEIMGKLGSTISPVEARLNGINVVIGSIQKYMSCKGACLASIGPDQPAEVVDDAPKNLNPGACLYTRTQSMLSCDGSHRHTRRLCPCA
ncbi:hypothetical protein CXB51_026107 [Gossypium anomalum]|uniref:Reverse transcriptase Ty1/copia-type domain-containing protein n=1 Tax=Gossypium anomalum TaxID=47600 RepID=A0A8J5YKE7_9ROSI|nr:hypothetical protein CXB51_026107 [Gossypium anomalum]